VGRRLGRGLRSPVIFLRGADASGPAIVVALGLAIETDMPVTKAAKPKKSATLAQAIETDTATVLVGRKVRSVNQALETDTAQVIGGGKAEPVLQAIETETAFEIVAIRGRTVSTALENDIAQSMGRLKTYFLGQSFESDIAQIIRPVEALTIAQAEEVDTAGELLLFVMRAGIVDVSDRAVHFVESLDLALHTVGTSDGRV
jgi:hypothetical protein